MDRFSRIDNGTVLQGGLCSPSILSPGDAWASILKSFIGAKDVTSCFE